MSDIITNSESRIETSPTSTHGASSRWVLLILIVLLGGGGWYGYVRTEAPEASAPVTPLPTVMVSKPLVRDIDVRLGALGQFAAVNRVELRAQVGGTLSEIHFKDGQLVRKGDLLFVIDRRPYEIKLAQARAQLATGKSRLDLATTQLGRAEILNRKQFTSQEVVDQRTAERGAAQAAIDDAQARIRDAELDLEYTRVTAPFAGRIGARQVSVGELIAGSRAASSPTTLLATLVSLDPIYVDFDMSEQDYLAFVRGRQGQKGPLSSRVDVSLSDETGFSRQGKLDFIDNALNRSSGTIRARATVPNADLFLSPGQFGRIRLTLTAPSPALLVPDASVIPDQSEHVVLTLRSDNVVTPKRVRLGDLRGGLRVIRSGLTSSDQVVIEGISAARPGAKVSPSAGSIQIFPDLSQD
jgi:membrane fusion protein, multidrug efflux system